jgi:hypothetical protein
MLIWEQQIGSLVYLAFALLIFAFVAIDSYHFDHMTPAEHLAAAKQAQNGDSNAVTDGLQHIAASLAAKNFEPVLQARAEQFRETALAARQIQAGQVAAVNDLGTSLKNLGYDVKVSKSDTAGEIAITSSEFSDTDHRVRFLAFVRKDRVTEGVSTRSASTKRILWNASVGEPTRAGNFCVV